MMKLKDMHGKEADKCVAAATTIFLNHMKNHAIYSYSQVVLGDQGANVLLF